jgi:hypothetical protein
MLWFAVLFLSMGVACCMAHQKPSAFLLSVADSDMKIAPDFSSPKAPGPDIAETGAAEFLYQRENGNIRRSRQVGKELANALLAYDRALEEAGGGATLQKQARILHAFAINKAVEGHSPNSIIAHAILSTFYETVEDKSELVSHEINDSAVFSLYLLATDDEPTTQELGELFGKLNENQQLSGFGERLYQKYYRTCQSKIEAAGFVR